MKGLDKSTGHGTPLEAFIALVQRIEPMVTRVVRRHLGISDFEEIQDIRQDAFERIYKYLTPDKLRKLAEKNIEVDAWALKVVINTGKSRLKARMKHPTMSLDYDQLENEWFEPVDYEKGYAQVEDADELERFLEEAVAKGIPWVTLKCLLLQRLEDSSIREIAQELGITEKSVENRIAYAKKQLGRIAWASDKVEPATEKTTRKPARKRTTLRSRIEDEVG
ncbi:MAG TPA: RNA polymerase sigma factor [Chloroflexia bacterium]